MTTLTRTLMRAALAATVAIGSAAAALAHESEKGPNGGQMVDVKGQHLELVAKGTSLTVYLSNADHAPVPSKGVSAKAVILAGKAQSTVALTAHEPNVLTGTLDKALPGGARVVVSAKLGDGQDLLARFVVK